MLNLHKHKNHLLCIRRCDCSNSKFPVSYDWLDQLVQQYT